MTWLDLDLVEALHRMALDHTGPEAEPRGYRPERRGLLSSALERPRWHYQYSGDERLSAYAAIYLVAIAKAHSFQQGNKRTALLATRTFLVLNGQSVTIPFPSPDKEQAFVRHVAREGVRDLGDVDSPLSLRDVADWIEAFYD